MKPDYDIEAILTRIETLEKNGIPGVRDFFATSALSILSNGEYLCNTFNTAIKPNQIAKFAYEIADAMIEERKK